MVLSTSIVQSVPNVCTTITLNSKQVTKKKRREKSYVCGGGYTLSAIRHHTLEHDVVKIQVKSEM